MTSTHLLALPAEDIAQRLYTRACELPEGVARVPLKEVHLNQAPALIAWNHPRADDHARLGTDVAAIEAKVGPLRARSVRNLAEKARQCCNQPASRTGADVDASLYDGFLGNGDKPPPRAGTHHRAGAARPRWKALPRPRACPSCCSATAHATIPAASRRLHQRWAGLPPPPASATAAWRTQLALSAELPALTHRPPRHWRRAAPGARCNRCATGAAAPPETLVSTYFSDASFRFLRSLARHNDKTWFNDHRHTVRRPRPAAVPASR
ncbi:hypothetical protein ACE0DR_25945 [Azotobacter sp. CWF10]